MDEVAALLLQVQSDMRAAEVLSGQSEEGLYCHIIAKYQQAIEKMIKALVAALGDAGIWTLGTGFSHDPERLLSALVRLPNQKRNLTLQAHILGVLTDHYRGEVKALCQLAPKRPQPGQLRAKNTEYPFHRRDGSWCVPAEAGVFSKEEVARFKRLADSLHPKIHKLITAIKVGSI